MYNIGTLFILIFMYFLVLLPIFLIFWIILAKLGLVETPEELDSFFKKLTFRLRKPTESTYDLSATAASLTSYTIPKTSQSLTIAYRTYYQYSSRRRGQGSPVIGDGDQ